MGTPPTFETDRLLLLPLTLHDAPQTQRLFPHWEIVRFLNASVPWPYPADGALSYYRDIAMPAMEQGREWHWTLRLKQSPETHTAPSAYAEILTTIEDSGLELPGKAND